MKPHTLIISEQFYSIQGEGPSAGTPAIFLRLGGCNLRCNGFSYKDPQTGEHLGCDTKKVWTKGTKQSFDEIIDSWQQQGWMDALNQGAHLVITGGEPLIQQTNLEQFISKLNNNIYIEIETNGTFTPSGYLLQRLNQFNVSPKLNNSGEPKNKAYNLEALTALAANKNTIFKFVVSQASDIDEILEQYVTPLKIPTQRIWLMPEGGTIEALTENSNKVVELCKKYLMNFSPRLHINIWNEATGV